MLTPRQQNLLKIIIENYIAEAQPLASSFLAEKSQEKISSATIRNEMSALEELEYIYQPYTSAGRIPTEKAYNFYVEKFLSEKLGKIQNNFKLNIKFSDANDQRLKIKDIAKSLAEACNLAVIGAFGTSDNYYTGLSNLFSQPEFCEQIKVVNISSLVESFDSILKKIYNQDYSQPQIWIGSQSHFSELCSFVVVKKGDVLLGILGPMRMDYTKNYDLLNKAIKFL